MRTVDKLAEEARGSFIWTLLCGRALEGVEHLKEEDYYQVKGGEKKLFELLDRRRPELDRTDEIGENIADVFGLRAKEGETVRQWCARARECFDKCARKTGVKCPEEARGWILLNQSGMAEEQRAVCLARAQGDLKFDQLAQSMRSCSPTMRRRSGGLLLSTWWRNSLLPRRMNRRARIPSRTLSCFWPNTALRRAQLCLPEDYIQDGFEEEEAAEILAATWREKRAELNMVQKGRKFAPPDSRRGAPAGKDFKRSFRVQVGS